MAQSGYTPILIYASGTPGAPPPAANLTSSANGAELALNYADGKLYYKNSSGVVTLLASAAAASGTSPGGSNTQVQYNNAGAFAGSSNLTFDGTSLTLGGNPTLSAGTANGVLYLNGSKVATSGSALVFDGTNLGVGVTPSAWSQGRAIELLAPGMGLFNAGSLGGPSLIYLTSNAYVNSGFKYGVNGEASSYLQWLGAHIWSTAPSGTAGNAITFSQVMTLDASGNLGIGTSSPATKVHAVGDNVAFRGLLSLQTATASNFAQITFYDRTTLGAQIYQGYQATAGVGDLTIQTAGASSALVFGTNATERMRLDSSGNLGLGVTPSAWGSSWKAFDFSNRGGLASGFDETDLNNNVYRTNTGAYFYKQTAAATTYNQSGGGHYWYTAPSGTAGNAITFTQAMTLDASGNLGLGVTPSAWLSTIKAQQISSNASFSTNTDFFSVGNNFYTNGSANDIYLASAYALKYRQVNSNGQHQWYNAPSGTAGNAITFTQAMTLDASGDFVVGDTVTGSIRITAVKSNPTRGILAHVYNTGSSGLTGAQIQFTQNTINNWVIGQPAGTDAFAFWSGRNTAADGTERARISAAGGFSVGTTADPGAGAIYATGAITAFYSDARLKDVKGTIINALDKVSSLSGVYYTNNEVAVAHGYTSAETQVGLLAQDVEAVLPEVVKAAPFDLDEKGNSKSGEHYKTIQYERVIPLLVEAIKELRAEVQALRG